MKIDIYKIDKVFINNYNSPNCIKRLPYLVIFFEKSMMPLAVNVMVALKLATASLTFAIWLKACVKKANPIAIISLSVLYAFSGWAMMYYQILSWLFYIYPKLDS